MGAERIYVPGHRVEPRDFISAKTILTAIGLAFLFCAAFENILP